MDMFIMYYRRKTYSLMGKYVTFIFLFCVNTIYCQENWGVINDNEVENYIVEEVWHKLPFRVELISYKDSITISYFNNIRERYIKAIKGCLTPSEELKVAKYTWYLENEAQNMIRELIAIDSLSKNQLVAWQKRETIAKLKMLYNLEKLYSEEHVLYKSKSVKDYTKLALDVLRTNRNINLKAAHDEILKHKQNFKRVVYREYSVLSFKEYFEFVDSIEVK